MQFYSVVFLCTVHWLQQHSSAAATIKGRTSSGWVKHLRVGDIIFPKSADIQQMSDYLTEMGYHDDSTACFGSGPSTVAEDGPLISLSKEDGRQKRDSDYEDYDTQTYKCLKEVDRVFYYPENAVGRLENGCTAFLVGPYHAMTSAKCVYDSDNRLWEKKLDFLRARNGSEYLQRMEWEELYIPREFLDSSSDDFDWALILFNQSEPSPVWHPFMYCHRKCPGPYSTTYGYNSKNMILKECEIFERECHKQVEMQCCQNNAANFHGGPVFSGYRFDGSKIPPVVGVSTLVDKVTTTDFESKSSNEEEAIIFDTAVKFYFEMFWTVCMLMENSGYDSNCKKL